MLILNICLPLNFHYLTYSAAVTSLIVTNCAVALNWKAPAEAYQSYQSPATVDDHDMNWEFLLIAPWGRDNLKQLLLWKASSFPHLCWNGGPQGIPWIIYNTWPVLHIYSKGRLQTLPMVQWTWGLSYAYHGNFFRLYNKFNMSTKHQHLG